MTVDVVADAAAVAKKRFSIACKRLSYFPLTAFCFAANIKLISLSLLYGYIGLATNHFVNKIHFFA